MSTLVSKFDSIETLIFEEGVRIKAIDIHADMNMMVVVLNTGAILEEKISVFPGLAGATEAELKHYELTGKGTGIHWPDIDEDISLKGLLRDTLKARIASSKTA